MAKTRRTAKHKDPHLRARQMFQEFMATDVDAQLFVFCAELYQAAASLAMPVENPENRPLVVDGDKVYALSDRPMNRGMLAVMKELREQGYPEDMRYAITSRLLHMGEIFEKKELAPFIKPGDHPGTISVSDALLHACAKARFVWEGEYMGFDIADVVRIARQQTDKTSPKSAGT